MFKRVGENVAEKMCVCVCVSVCVFVLYCESLNA